MSPRSPLPVLTLLTAGILGIAGVHAQQVTQDAPPLDINNVLRELQGMAAKNDAAVKTSKQAALAQVSAAASAADGGVKFWQSAVQATQIAGAGGDANAFRVWRETDGEVFKEKEVQSAVHLHLEWLALTLQRSIGATVKEMVPAVQNYTRELWADQAWMAMIDESMKKEKEKEKEMPNAPKGRANPAAKNLKDESAARRMHDQILNHGLGGSIIVQWLKIGDFVSIEKWEGNPGNLDGIYRNILLPEFRATKDQRVFEYWDTKMKLAADTASKSKLTFEIDKYNTETRPGLMWSRAQEYIALGQKNRAATEMYNIIKAYPNSPSAADWISSLQGLLAPPPPTDTPATATAAPAAPAPAPAAPAAAVIPPAAPAAAALPPLPPLPPPGSPNGPTPTALLPGAQ